VSQTTRPNSAARLALGLVFAAGLAATIGIQAVGAAFVGHETPAFELTGGEAFELAGLMPGDARDAGVVHVTASGSVTYRVRVEWTGSAELARELNLTLTDAAGSVLYRGPLGDAHLDRQLIAGEAASIVARAELPLAAGDEVQGASLTARLVLELTESVD
jgi:hypothetical protein